MKQIYVIKKDGNKVPFDGNKIINAIKKSAERVMVKLSKDEEEKVVNKVRNLLERKNINEINVKLLHNFVELALSDINNSVCESYRTYRNYKQEFVEMLDESYRRSQKIMFLGDKENSNTDSALVATKRVLSYNEINRQFYKKFFLTKSEVEAIESGFIYIHDASARRDTYNCCLFDTINVMTGGFEMGNMWYNEPTDIDKALDVLGDVISVKAGQQYGGLTIPEVDKLLAPYVEKTYIKIREQLMEDIVNLTNDEYYVKENLDKLALERTITVLEDGLQGIEYKCNSVGSSRGDYPFITFTFGENTDDEYSNMVTSAILKVRKKGQGKKGKKKCVLFPKLVFLYVEEKHGEGQPYEWLFDEAIDCSSKAMYPDYLSLSGEGYIAEMYKKYKKIISPMGCRAFLSPYFERGGFEPADEDDIPVFVGRFNIGAISLHLPMIYQEAKITGKDFYEVLNYYMEMIRGIHLRTYEYLGNMRASMDPIAFCEGGFYGGNLQPGDRIEPVLKSATASFGITALNELQQIHNGKSLVEDNLFALEVMRWINNKIQEYKEADGRLYAIYGTPAESLCGKQVIQFRKKFGIVEGISDREYVSNSFHCHVAEKITGLEKQDRENEFWDLFNGGKIQYVKYPMGYNKKAIKVMVKRAMKLGLYEGVNLALSFCDDCGYETTSATEVCPECNSHNLTKIERMNGYLSFSRVKGDTRLNDAKMAEIKDRVSM